MVQTTHEEESIAAAHVRTSGEVRLRRLPKDSKYGSHFTLDVRVSDPRLAIINSWDDNSRTLNISTPQHANLDTSVPLCISLEITVWLPEDAKIRDLKVRTTTLALRVIEDIKVNVSGHAEFASVTGEISFPKFIIPKEKSKTAPSFPTSGHTFNSRRIEVKTVSGSIHGLYPLYDFLGVYSGSGSVAIGVLPHSVDIAAPSPATLDVKTTSSSINVHLPVPGSETQKLTPPPRDYVTHVRSVSGTISGSYYLGSSTTIKSTSGTLGVTVLPAILRKGHYRENVFETGTQSASTEINILDPIFFPSLSRQNPKQPGFPYQPIGDHDPYLLLPPMKPQRSSEESKLHVNEGKLRSLRSSHTSRSGTIKVHYPSAWEGTIFAEVVTGSISVTGEGVTTIREKNGWGHKEVFARKGVDKAGEGSSVEIRSTTGGIHFDV